MNDASKKNLETQLQALTEWDGEETALWKTVLERSEQDDSSKHRRNGFLVVGKPLLMAASFVLMVSIVAVLVTQSTGRARRQASIDPSAQIPTESYSRALRGQEFSDETTANSSVRVQTDRFFDSLSSNTIVPASPKSQGDIVSETHADFGRDVIRKATIEIRVDDVHGALAKIHLISSEFRGEFIETSALRGEGANTHGEITLRVENRRLSEVLNHLRELGEVGAEQVRGEDVTDRVVDLEARLRNERRVEAELLELLEARENDELKDVLALRAEISNVRSSIERLVGQRERLGRLVQLATVVVMVRAAEAQTPVESGLGAHWRGAMSDAWTNGVRAVADSLSFIVRVVVGSVVWWTLALMIVILANHLWKRHAARAAIGM